jgi:ADP-ribose pyrophosphatase
MIEKTLSSKRIYEGKILNLRIDEVLLPNNNTSHREIVEHNGAVAIVAVNSDNKILLVKQYRKAIDEIMIEIPAGKLEKEESPYECAKRELIEETGFRSNKMDKIFEIITSPGFCDEKIHLFIAKELQVDYMDCDDDEFIDVIEVSIDDAMDMIYKGIIKDSKTIIGLYHYKMHF